MINTNYSSVSNTSPSSVTRQSRSNVPAEAGPTDGFMAGGRDGGFECPVTTMPVPQPTLCPGLQPGWGGATIEPVATIEPWLMGTPTTNPAVGAKFADRLVRNCGEQALLSIEDSRIGRVSGYFLEGWESVGGSDFLTNVGQAALGDKWELNKDGNFELRGGNATQVLSFDQQTKQTRLQSSYEEQVYDTSRFTEILTRDQDGVMRRDTPPVGI